MGIESPVLLHSDLNSLCKGHIIQLCKNIFWYPNYYTELGKTLKLLSDMILMFSSLSAKFNFSSSVTFFLSAFKQGELLLYLLLHLPIIPLLFSLLLTTFCLIFSSDELSVKSYSLAPILITLPNLYLSGVFHAICYSHFIMLVLTEAKFMHSAISPNCWTYNDSAYS